jgi:hypothetical protein
MNLVADLVGNDNGDFCNNMNSIYWVHSIKIYPMGVKFAQK